MLCWVGRSQIKGPYLVFGQCWVEAVGTCTRLLLTFGTDVGSHARHWMVGAWITKLAILGSLYVPIRNLCPRFKYARY